MNDANLPEIPGRVAASTGNGAAQPIVRRKLSHEVLERLLARIRAHEFPVGSWLPSERELMLAFGVGRPAIREALQALERMGLVSIVHGEGARVLPLTADTIIGQIRDPAMHLLLGSQDIVEHLKQARHVFEVAMAQHAARHATDADIAKLRQALELHRASVDDPQRFYETDMAFHRTIAEVSGNPIFAAVAQAMLEWLYKLNRDSVQLPGSERITLAEHVKLFERIAARDPEGAAKVLTHHVTRAHKTIGSDGERRRTASAARPSRGKKT